MLYNQYSLGLPESSYTTVYIRSFGFIYYMKYMYIYRFYNCHAITFSVQNGFSIWHFKTLDKIYDHRLVDFQRPITTASFISYSS